MQQTIGQAQVWRRPIHAVSIVVQSITRSGMSLKLTSKKQKKKRNGMRTQSHFFFFSLASATLDHLRS